MNMWSSRMSAVMFSGSGYVSWGLEMDEEEDKEVRGVLSGLRASGESLDSKVRAEFVNVNSWCTVEEEECESSVSEVLFEDGECVLNRVVAAERL